MRNAAAAPNAATITPPIAGPTLRAMLNPRLFIATAAGTTGRGTTSPIEADTDGALTATPQPMRKVKTKSVYGDSTSAKAQATSRIETLSMNSCASIITRRRLRLSAIAPANSDSNMIGKVVDD